MNVHGNWVQFFFHHSHTMTNDDDDEAKQNKKTGFQSNIIRIY